MAFLLAANFIGQAVFVGAFYLLAKWKKVFVELFIFASFTCLVIIDFMFLTPLIPPK